MAPRWVKASQVVGLPTNPGECPFDKSCEVTCVSMALRALLKRLARSQARPHSAAGAGLLLPIITLIGSLLADALNRMVRRRLLPALAPGNLQT